MARAVVYLRFPQNRNGVQDPPAVEWNLQKEQELWSMLKVTNTDMEWRELAQHFGVSLVYILQQAAWLFEKELGMLRKRMNKISTSFLPNEMARSKFNIRSTDSLPVTTAVSALGRGREAEEGDSSIYAQPHSTNTTQLSHPSTSLGDRSTVDSLPSSEDEGAGFSSRRLLSSSRLISSEHDSELSDSFDGFLPNDNSDFSSGTSSNSTVSQSALEAALIEQGSTSETSET